MNSTQKISPTPLFQRGVIPCEVAQCKATLLVSWVNGFDFRLLQREAVKKIAVALRQSSGRTAKCLKLETQNPFVVTLSNHEWIFSQLQGD
jgi:hypothetical protein